MKLSGKTKVCGVIGDPIEHTLSPVMHNAAFNYLNLDYVYVAFKVKRAELEKAIDGMRCLDIYGLNVTMPHKNAIMRYLDEVDSTAKFVGAINTILNDGKKLLGFNTDGVGAIKALKNNGVDLNGKKLLLLGAGGAGKTIAFHMAKAVKEVVILNRTAEKAKKLAGVLTRKFEKRIIGNSLSLSLVKEHLKDSDILINATSVGMHPKTNQSLVAPQWLRSDLYVMDIIYNPIETQLAKDAKLAGAKVISGIEMLISQGAVSLEIWTGCSAPIEIMKEAILNRLSKTGATH